MAGATARRTLKTRDFDLFQRFGREEEQCGGAENMDTDAPQEEGEGCLSIEPGTGARAAPTGSILTGPRNTSIIIFLIRFRCAAVPHSTVSLD